ncbi:hypothetical protein PHJA_002783000 [Phtheirospermum japonicum]|uniref:DUF3475 domain-containing protein n=1 Tax=Phtheirospermum japonicum TaxID=374723 RepID=A0A830D518_9LAMI|nr:hypothetical protein PHJA_002783000 [Phtheirospermum japonicum]
MTNLNLSSGFAFGIATKGISISILAFEVAKTIVKGANLMNSLSHDNIRHLKEAEIDSKCRSAILYILNADGASDYRGLVVYILSLQSIRKQNYGDVIAEVCGCDDICEMERYGVLTKRVTIHLRNVSDAHGPVIIILQYAMVKTFRGVKCLQNSLYASRLMLNAEIPQSMEYMKSVEKISGDVSSRTTMLVMGDMLLSLEFKSIEELDSISEDIYRAYRQPMVGVTPPSGDYDAFPDELDELLEKTFLFKLDLNKYTVKCKHGRVYTVGKLSCDEKIIGPYLEKEFLIKSTVSSIGDSGMKSEFATPSSKRTTKRTVAGVSDAEQPEDEFDTQISSSKTNIRLKALPDQ